MHSVYNTHNVNIRLTTQNITIKGLVLTFRVEILKAASNSELYLTFRTASHNFVSLRLPLGVLLL